MMSLLSPRSMRAMSRAQVAYDYAAPAEDEDGWQECPVCRGTGTRKHADCPNCDGHGGAVGDRLISKYEFERETSE